MPRFTQLHLLTSYPPANLNRDDLGRPKTATMGGYQRLRVSSQCLKRNWRTSDIFEAGVSGQTGTRTKLQGPKIVEKLTAGGFERDAALKIAKAIVDPFGDIENDKKDHKHKQVVHYSPSEQAAIDSLVDTLIADSREPTDEELQLLQESHKAVDIAMFGRMLAASPKYNMEAAVQVAHALTVHEAQVEDDFFTAVDDLNDNREDAGSAHMGNTGFGAGLFYTYICIDRAQLAENLQDDAELASRAIAALTEAAAKVAPSGKQNSFASRAYASYVLAENGDEQPRSLAAAFLRPVATSSTEPQDILAKAVRELRTTRDDMDQAYGPCAEASYELNVAAREGSFDQLLEFVRG